MVKKIVIYSAFVVLVLFVYDADSKKNQEQEKQWIPPKGFVPNESTARKIAEAVLLPIYGNQIIKQKPFNVELIGDSIWVVTGVQKELIIGGVAYIEIQKSDCKILKVTHGK